MGLLIKVLLFIHIGTGAVALFAAPVAMLSRKGGKVHRKSGKVFFWCMTIVIVTAVVISLYKFIPFLLMIAALSYYSIISGYRALYHKSLYRQQTAKTIDWLALSINAAANLAFIIWGVTLIAENQSLAILAIVFGGIGLSLSVSNVITFLKRPTDKMFWLYAHISGFMGGYIASVTAFSVTVLQFIPGIWAWLWPTLVGTPIISIWIAYYKRKFIKGSKPAELLIMNK